MLIGLRLACGDAMKSTFLSASLAAPARRFALRADHATSAVGRSRSRRHLDQRDADHAAARARARDEGVLHGRGSRRLGEAAHPGHQCRSSAARGRGGCLQRRVLRARHARRQEPAHVAHHRSTRMDAFRRSRPRRSRKWMHAEARGGESGRSSRRSLAHRAVHPVRRHRADAARAVQQQLPDRAESRLRDDPRRDESRRARDPAGPFDRLRVASVAHRSSSGLATHADASKATRSSSRRAI